jgi:hypothetical protein
MTVEVKPMSDGQVKERRPALAAGSVLLLFGVPLWLAGARYTFDGWLSGLALFADWLGVPINMPALDWRIYLVLVVTLGLLYSRIEIAAWRAASGRRLARVPSIYWALWFLVLVTDLGSTYLGVITSRTGAWPIMVWVAQTWIVAGLWTGVLTFAPEWLILGGIKLLRG